MLAFSFKGDQQSLNLVTILKCTHLNYNKILPNPRTVHL
jgi:hypothetical protein